MATTHSTQAQPSVNKLMLTFVTLSTVIFIGILLVVITPKINTIFDEFKQESQNASTAIFASQLNQYIKDRELATRDITSNDSLSRALLANNSEDPSFRDYLNHILLLGEDASFTILDIGGNVFYSETKHEDYSWAKPVIEEGISQLVQITTYNNKPYFEIATPIYYGKSKEGVLISRINASPDVVLGNTVDNLGDTDIIYQANGVTVQLAKSVINDPVITHTNLLDYPITLTYITSKENVNASKKELLLGILLSVSIGLLLAFFLQLWIGKKLLSEPYRKLALTEVNLINTIEELKEANNFQELINESTPDLIFVKDNDLNIVKANPNFLALYPIEIRDSVIGSSSLDSSHDEAEAEAFHAMDRKAFNDGYSDVVETITFPTGEIKSLYTQKIRFEDQQKNVFILGIARDVTDREREAELLNQLSNIAINDGQTVDEKIQSALQHSLAYFKLSLAIVSQIDDSTYTISHTTADKDSLKPGDTFPLGDTYCSFVYKNAGVKAWHNAGKSEIATHPCYTKFMLESYIGTTLHIDGKVHGTLNFTASEERKKPFSEREKTFINTIAQWVGYQLSSQKNLEKKETIIKQLTQSNEQLEQFAYICSHDLQEPLRMVGSFSELLKEHMANSTTVDEKSQRYLDFLLDGAKRAKELIRDILSYSKLDKDTIRPEPIELTLLVEQIKHNIESNPSDTKITIEYGELPTVIGNKTQLYQLFQNLINNGIKYQPENNLPHITISAVDDGENWLFNIIDNGIGIEPAHQTKIFEIFKRLHGRNEFAGTGIGLSICKKIVEGHDGKIWVESAPEKGSKFCFTLPKSANIRSC